MSDALVQSATIQLKAQAGGGFGSVPDVELENGTLITINAGSGVNFGAGPILTGITGFGTGLMESQSLGTVLPVSYTDDYSTSWFNEYADVTRRQIAELDGLRVLKSTLGRNETHGGAGLTGIDLGVAASPGDKFMLSSWAKANPTGDVVNCQWKTYRIQPTKLGADLGLPDSLYSKTFASKTSGGEELTMYTDTARTHYNGSNHPIYNNNWTRHDLLLTLGTEGGSDGTFRSRGIKTGQTGVNIYYMDYSGAPTWTGNGDVPNNTAGNPNWRWLMDQEFINNNYPTSYLDSCEVYRRERYYQKGWARVELCDTDSVTTMTEAEIQPYIAWSAGQLTIKLWKGPMTLLGKKIVIYDDNDAIIASADLTSTTVTAEAVV